MAELIVLGHTVKPGVKLIACGGVKISEVDLAVHLVPELGQKRASLRAYVELKVNKIVKILILIVRILLHKLGKRLTLDEVGDDSPLAAVYGGDALDLGDVETRLLYSCLVEGFVEDISLGIIGIEHLVAKVAVTVYNFILAFSNHICKIHITNYPPSYFDVV